MTIFAVITIILLVLTFINACVCFSNFNRGLRDYLVGNRTEDTERKQIDGSGPAYDMDPQIPWNPQGNRLAIE
jgi:hypothetical protein